MRVTMIGHSTVLIESAGKKILTDPFFGPRGNPAYMRVTPPAQSREAFYGVDIMLVSHHHWDHVDAKLLRALPANVPVLVPKAATGFARLFGARNPVGLKPWESRQFNTDNVSSSSADIVGVTAIPAVHFAITHGFVITGEGRQTYFAGDTFYAPFMAEVGRRFRLDVALIPVTTFRIPMTMGEKQAVRAVQDLKPRIVIPIHLGVQPRSPLLRTNHTPEGFIRRLREAGLETDVALLQIGESETF